jgi:transposase
MKLYSDEAIAYRDKLVVEARASGLKQAQIANMYGMHQSTVCRILKLYRSNGNQLPLPRSTTASKQPALGQEDDEALKSILKDGALAHGFDTDCWDRGRIKEVIEKKFKVTYHVSHISKVARRLGFTLQKPKRKDYRQDAARKEAWIAAGLPALKKSQ